MRFTRHVAWVALSLSLGACQVFAFDEIKNEAPIVAISAPEGVGTGFGGLLAAVTFARDYRDSPMPVFDAGGGDMDAGAMDSTMPDAALDASAPDSGAPDGGSPDSGPPPLPNTVEPTSPFRLTVPMGFGLDSSLAIGTGRRGAKSPVAWIRVWRHVEREGSLREVSSFADEYALCREENEESEDCPDDFGAAIAAVETWTVGRTIGAQGCIAASERSEGSPRVRVQCDRPRASGDGNTFPIPAPDGHITDIEAFRSEGDVDQQLFVGLADHRDSLFVLNRNNPARLVQLPDDVASGRELGANLVAHSLGQGSYGASNAPVLLLIAAPETNQVFVTVYGEFGGRGSTLRTLACLDGRVRAPAGAPDEGSEFALGDFNGDSIPEVIVGSGEADEQRVVRVYNLNDLNGAIGCNGETIASEELSCDDVDADSPAECGSLFGAGLAVGDLDNDGFNELLVGDPTAKVGEASGAGAIFVYRGSVSGLMGTPHPLYRANPDADERLGTAVTTVQTALDDPMETRTEAVGGAPGADEGSGRAYVFLCSNLDGDRPDGANRCLPAQQ